jgi:hypothetical protein
MKLSIGVFLLLVSGSVSAQTVPIIEGKHEDFTRFVATIPVETQWTTREREGAFILELPVGFTFELDALSDETQGNHRTSINSQPDSNKITFAFNCDCHGSISVYNEVFLVIDIQQNAANTFKATATEPEILDDSWWRNHLSLGAPFNKPNQNIDESRSIARHGETYVPERLIRELSSSTIDGRTELRNQEENKPGAFDAAVPAEVQQDLNGIINIGVSASRDGDPMSAPTPMEPSCEAFNSEALFSADEKPADYNAIIQLRSSVYSEAGSPNPDLMIKLAVEYLRLGLALEAQQVLKETPIVTNEVELLSQISNLFEPHPQETDFWDNYRDCENSLHFWYTLQWSRDSKNEIKSDVTLLHFKATSTWLQQLLADRLYDTLISNGDISAANELHAYSELVVLPDPTTEPTPVVITPRMAQIRRANRDRPENMLSILDSGGSGNTVRLSEAIRFEHQETPLWSNLLEAEIMFELEIRGFATALEKLTELKMGGTAEADVDRVANHVFMDVAQNANDTDFLASYFQKDQWPLSSDVTGALSTRLATFGLPELVKPVEDMPTSFSNRAVETQVPPDPETSSPNYQPLSTDLDSARIRALITDTQSLRSSVMEQMSTKAQ